MLSKAKIGFGKYNTLSIQTIYAGTQDIPLEVFQLFFKTIFCSETSLAKFSCSTREELAIVLNSISGRLFDSIIRQMVENRFYELIQKSKYRFCIGDAHDYDKSKILNREDDASYIDYSDYSYQYDVNYANYKDDYEFSLSEPMTDQNCSFFKFEIAKQYVTISCDSVNNENCLDFTVITKLMLEKHKGVFEMTEGYANPYAIDLHKMSTPYHGYHNQSIIFFGAPSYLDWALANGKLFIWPETLDKLESLEVNCPPEFVSNYGSRFRYNQVVSV